MVTAVAGFKRFNEILTKISEGLSFAGALWMFAIMFIVVVDVVGRFFFNTPFVGATEIVRNSIIGIAFFMIPWAIVEERHVRSTILVDRLSEQNAKIINVATYLLGCLIFVGIIVGGWEPMLKAIIIREYEGEGALRVPTYPVRIIILIGSFFSAWHCFCKIAMQIIPKQMLEERG